MAMYQPLPDEAREEIEEQLRDIREEKSQVNEDFVVVTEADKKKANLKHLQRLFG